MSLLDGRERVLLAVAGHDPSYAFQDGRGEGAGVDADREAAGQFGVACVSVVTAWTEQEQGRVLDIGAVQPAIWLHEALRYLAELRASLGAIKFGLLPSAEAVRAASQLVRQARVLMPRIPVVVDPVLAASGGEVFVDGEGRRALLEDLLGQGIVLTPNWIEACDLSELPLKADGKRLAAAMFAKLDGRDSGCRGLVLKGGHGGEDPVRDWIVDAQGALTFHRHPRKLGASLHGSGCRHASAVAANLALGHDLVSAAGRAGDWVASLVR